MKKIPDEILPRWQKLLLVLLELSSGLDKAIKFEDIVAAAFKRYPETFHLRGYVQYPDSGDIIHKPLYEMRKNGLITAHKKTFVISNKGLRFAEEIKKQTSKGGRSYFKPSRDIKPAIERVLGSEAYSLFTSNQTNRILDTDFLQYLGTSVHTGRNEFKNRLVTLEDIINTATSHYPEEICANLLKYHKFMIEKFKKLINDMTDQ
jgi:hypothetical protein